MARNIKSLASGMPRTLAQGIADLRKEIEQVKRFEENSAPEHLEGWAMLRLRMNAKLATLGAH